MRINFAWECIETSNREATFRAQVPNGWLVRHDFYAKDEETILFTTTTFVPDDGSWEPVTD